MPKNEKGTVTCTRCGYNWLPRVKKPKACTFCKSYDWDKPFKRKRRATK